MEQATLAVLFTVANAIAIAGWVPLIVAPRWAWTRHGITIAVATLMAIGYTILLLSGLGQTDGGFGSLEAVMLLFTSPQAVLTGWIHYLVFDLFVGTWITMDWQTTGHPHLWIVPVLGLTFLAGPAGFLLYLIVRAAVRRDVRVAVTGP